MKEEKQSGKQLAEDAQDVVHLAMNPDRAVQEMRESDEYEGQAFDEEEIRKYIQDRFEEISEDNPRSYSGISELQETFRYITGMESDPKFDHMESAIYERLQKTEGIASEQIDGDTYFMTEEDHKKVYGE